MRLHIWSKGIKDSPFLVLNEGRYPEVFLHHYLCKFAVRGFRYGYVFQWKRGDGFSLQRPRLLPKCFWHWHPRIAELDKRTCAIESLLQEILHVLSLDHGVLSRIALPIHDELSESIDVSDGKTVVVQETYKSVCEQVIPAMGAFKDMEKPATRFASN